MHDLESPHTLLVKYNFNMTACACILMLLVFHDTFEMLRERVELRKGDRCALNCVKDTIVNEIKLETYP